MPWFKCGNISELYNITYMLRGNNRLSLLRTPKVLEHVFAFLLIWLFQFNCLLKGNPRTFNSYTMSTFILSNFSNGGFTHFLLAVLKIYI